ncbi:glucosaminidase domain-containing protein (plasmid) [Pontibacillus sp. ALD_SL1]|uniref:N-acetylglucosaminidase n=1 Tax=Pontibacillus sp. ALD_SL1 TaxID=2777185 RepID=UPI001A95728E|nr:glucosaminidase domain-containing protein [Pontibacillus sp. ALD_SL1]QST02960.1 glucosaminidase domain-containing protein [Pontibacillus sp. ALD_SL1]
MKLFFRTLLVLVMSITFFTSPADAADENTYLNNNGSFTVVYPTGNKSTLATTPSALMKIGEEYIRRTKGRNHHYYRLVEGKDPVYAFTYDVPYTIINLNQPSSLSGNDIDINILLKSSSSPLYSWGHSFKKAEEEYGINALYLMSHAALETGWGKSDIATDKNNLFGFKAYDWDPYNNAAPFANFEDSILYVAKYVKENYLTEGGIYYHGPHLKGMNTRYATDPLWSDKIASIMNRFIPWDCTDCFYTKSDGLYVKKMAGEQKISSEKPWHFFDGVMYQRIGDVFVEQETNRFAAMVEEPFSSLTSDENLYQNATTSDLVFKAVPKDTSPSVYKEADVSSEEITTLEPGTVFVVREETDTMMKLMLQDKTYGWIKKSDTY